ncbi:MAG TPA: MFS transporter, partial [Rubrivivax sp.]|nr:MFS transporter [Rubrivivax sp.]
FGALFQGGLARDTLALCAAFFMVVLALYTAFSWLPTMLANEGIPVAIASQGLTAYNLGGVIGALLCAVFIARFGSRWPMVLACLAAALSAFAMSNMKVTDNVGLLIFGFGVHGMFVNAAQVSLYALCAYVFQTNVRATGTATALAVGRGGGIVSSFTGAAVITSGGASGFLGLLAAAMVLAALAVFAVRRHIPSLARRGAAATPIAASH